MIRKGIPAKGLTHLLYHRSKVTLLSPDTGQRHIIRNKTLCEGQAVVSEDRELPELGADNEGNLYITSFGFHYNIRLDGQWGSSRKFARASNIGFVETAGYSDFAYAVCEEGASVKVYDSTSEKPVPVDIMIGRLSKDGTLSGF